MKDGKPVTIACKGCGTLFTRAHPSQKYCTECAMEKRRTSSLASKSKKLTEKDIADLGRWGAAHAPMTPFETPGWSTEGKSLRLVAAEARELGMSYGEYTSAIQSGRIEKILLSRGMTPEEWRAKLRAAKKKVSKR